MGRIITVYGVPHSGKTTLSLKLGKQLYNSTKAKVIVLFTDCDTPSLPVLFPQSKASELHSVGELLTKQDLYADEILANAVTSKDNLNFALLGYIYGESENSYPFDPIKAEQFLSALSQMADYVIVDCAQNRLSAIAQRRSASKLYIVSPELSSISYYASQGLPDSDCKMIMNSTEANPAPIDEARAYFHQTKYVIPFSNAVKQQYYDGKLIHDVSDRKFGEAMSALAGEVI